MDSTAFVFACMYTLHAAGAFISPVLSLQVQRVHRLAEADFPNVQAFSKILSSIGLDKLHKVSEKHVRTVEEVINADIPMLVRQFSPP